MIIKIFCRSGSILKLKDNPLVLDSVAQLDIAKENVSFPIILNQVLVRCLFYVWQTYSSNLVFLCWMTFTMEY